jgi:triosephosphate isomerase (TIM)
VVGKRKSWYSFCMGKLIVANWKMNPATEAEAVLLAKEVDLEGAVICPPFAFVASVGDVLKRAKLGAQDVFWEGSGAYTGEVSAHELKSVGVEYVIVGHSERRAFGETDEVVNKKVRAVLGEGLVPILCVGESREVRDKGIETAKEFIRDQLGACLVGVSTGAVVAYEPIWAISTSRAGEPETPEDAAEMISFIKEQAFGVCTLYGGSVNAENAAGFLSQEAIGGALVGGASLKPGEFTKIIELSR